ncbi:MAG: DNA translocase FtsK 4TM domain-containing protein [Elusimicrobia bacterium]|nr:DNA translocase FtsK 4TM domain-containing protein [Elusimicrobiota bacterium]
MQNFVRNRFAAPNKKKSGNLAYVLYWLLSFSFSVWLIWLLFSAPAKDSVLGGPVAAGLFNFLGKTAYVFPFILLYGLIAILLKLGKPHKGVLTLLAGAFLLLGSISSVIDILGARFGAEVFDGGWLGYALEGILAKMFGKPGAALFSGVIFFAGLQLLFKISWRRVYKAVSQTVADDYRNWAAARAQLRSRLKLITDKEGAESPVYQVRPIPEPPSAPDTEGPPRPDAAPELRIVRARTEAPAHKEKEPVARPAAGGAKIAARPRDDYYRNFKLPNVNLLEAPADQGFIGPTDEEIAASKRLLEDTFKSFNISVSVSGVHPGPVITRFEVKPAPGVKISSIVSLSNDVALAMKSSGGIRVIAPIPGKDAIGFEIPNVKRAKVCLRELLESSVLNEKKNPLMFGLGRYAEGAVAVADLETMPHLLVAGATASGKSIFMQSLILSLIYRNTPDEVKFLFIDPKRLELTFYEDIPYLYDPNETPDRVSVITSPKDAAKSLIALTRVMEQRYIKFEKARVKNIASYNKWALANGEPTEHYIVVVIDELADLILQMKNVVEDAIQRLAQMARAVGIHLVLATQRPSVDIITGVIKANLPSRVALQVTSKTDSRVILDAPGAESLIGKGDMLYLAIDAQKPVRVQGAYVSEEEVKKVAEFLRAQARPHYQMLVEEDASASSGKGGSSEELINAMRLIVERRRVSQDLLKAHFGSSARATNLLSILETNGFIRKPEGSNRWEINFDRIEGRLAAGDKAEPEPPERKTPARGPNMESK